MYKDNVERRQTNLSLVVLAVCSYDYAIPLYTG